MSRKFWENPKPSKKVDENESTISSEYHDSLAMNEYDTSFLLYVKWAVENKLPLRDLVRKYNKEPQNWHGINMDLSKLESLANRIERAGIVICTDYTGHLLINRKTAN